MFLKEEHNIMKHRYHLGKLHWQVCTRETQTGRTQNKLDAECKQVDPKGYHNMPWDVPGPRVVEEYDTSEKEASTAGADCLGGEVKLFKL